MVKFFFIMFQLMVLDGLVKGLTGEKYISFHAQFETTNKWEC